MQDLSSFGALARLLAFYFTSCLQCFSLFYFVALHPHIRQYVYSRGTGTDQATTIPLVSVHAWYCRFSYASLP